MMHPMGACMDIKKSSAHLATILLLSVSAACGQTQSEKIKLKILEINNSEVSD